MEMNEAFCSPFLSPLPLREGVRGRGRRRQARCRSSMRAIRRTLGNAAVVGDDRLSSRCRAEPLPLTPSRKGRGDPFEQ